jgi:hypothetical protein
MIAFTNTVVQAMFVPDSRRLSDLPEDRCWH